VLICSSRTSAYFRSMTCEMTFSGLSLTVISICEQSFWSRHPVLSCVALSKTSFLSWIITQLYAHQRCSHKSTRLREKGLETCSSFAAACGCSTQPVCELLNRRDDILRSNVRVEHHGRLHNRIESKVSKRRDIVEHIRLSRD